MGSNNITVPPQRPKTVGHEDDFSSIERVFAQLREDSAEFSNSITKAMIELLKGTQSFEQSIRSVALSLSKTVLNSATSKFSETIQNGLTGILDPLIPKILTGADGPVIRPYAKGGILSRPTFFPSGDIMNLAGEAGPEAVLPLARGPDGRLGVSAGGGGSGGINVTMNVSTPNAQSFQKSEMQIASSLARAVQRGRRGL